MQVEIEHRVWKLLDFFLDESEVKCGLFSLGEELKEMPLLELEPPPCKLKPIYEVRETYPFHFVYLFGAHSNPRYSFVSLFFLDC